MKKILVIFNGADYSGSLSKFAIEVAKQGNALLHAVFMNPLPASQPVYYPYPNDLSLAGNEMAGLDLPEDNTDLIEANAQLFKDDCAASNANYTIDPDHEITIEELIDHSAFADLIIAEAKTGLGSYSLQDLLTDTHCPVLVFPGSSGLPRRAVLCYDESFSSIYAIKMYSYLFPEWSDLSTSVISINPKGDNGDRYDNYLSDWLPQHFSQLSRESAEGNLQKELVHFISKDEQPTIVVMGSFGRNAMSRLFHKSLANIVMQETAASIFIMHE